VCTVLLLMCRCALCCVCATALKTGTAVIMDVVLYKPVQDLCIRVAMLLRRGLHSMQTHFIFTVCCGYSALVSGTATEALPLPGWDNWDCSLRNCPKGHTADRRNGTIIISCLSVIYVRNIRRCRVQSRTCDLFC
jgi:hypothetical protein